MVILFYPEFLYILSKKFLIRSAIHVAGSHFYFFTLSIIILRNSCISKIRSSGIATVRDLNAFAKCNKKMYAQIWFRKWTWAAPRPFQLCNIKNVSIHLTLLNLYGRNKLRHSSIKRILCLQVSMKFHNELITGRSLRNFYSNVLI